MCKNWGMGYDVGILSIRVGLGFVDFGLCFLELLYYLYVRGGKMGGWFRVLVCFL